jgi:hypothetical protein
MPPTHARSENWTLTQALLGSACCVLGIGIAVLGFIDIYLTVTHLLHPLWGAWSWTVILLGEGSFTGSYLGWLLLDLRDRPPARVRAFLACYLSSFAAGSLLLNLYAGQGTVPGVVSHAIVVVAFFGYLIFVKVLVRRLSADPDARALETGLADARQHAIDLVHDRKGVLWRYRVPSLLRRQILTGRLPDEVRREVTLKVGAGATGGWEATVRAWVLRELNLPALAERADAEAVADITRSAPASEPETASQARPAARGEARPGPALRLAASRSRSMSASDLEPHVSAMLEAYGTVSQARVKRDLHVSTEKAAEALRLAKRDRTVVRFGSAR